jgi:hypothetical protein
LLFLKSSPIPKQIDMTEKKVQPPLAESEGIKSITPFNTTIAKREEKGLQKATKESKPSLQTYIYRSYGGGYQGL